MPPRLVVHHRVARDDLALGLVRVDGVRAGPAPGALEAALRRLLEARRAGTLPEEAERHRQGGRAILKNGRYRATGRGKPASEYLLREASEGSFPRVNGPVDACNLVSLEHLVSISLWDRELAAGLTALAPGDPQELELRLGRAGERYVFNPTGQSLELEDLITGCALARDGSSRPIVTPVKDSLATKLTERSRSVGGCLYYPLGHGSQASLASITEAFLGWLCACGEQAEGACAVALAGERVEL
jgi:DNA/RNA-binding domain of Phe-tRNA-synthetase-like protein